MGKQRFESDIKLREVYRDENTGFTGRATSITFFEFSCERAGIEAYDETTKQIRVEIFDAPRLINVESGAQASTTRTGGPGEPNSQRGPNLRWTDLS
jgi:hypothetical protein